MRPGESSTSSKETGAKVRPLVGRPLQSFGYISTFRPIPFPSIASAAEEIGITFPTVAGAIDHMQELDIIRKITGKQRGRLFAYGRYLDILNEGTEPLR
jgi:hypothetical protein